MLLGASKRLGVEVELLEVAATINAHRFVGDGEFPSPSTSVLREDGRPPSPLENQTYIGL